MRQAHARFTLTPRGPFSLEPVRRLQCGFLRGTRTCNVDDGPVTVAFPSDGTFAPVAARLSLAQSNMVDVELFGSDDVVTVRPQLERMLASDHDAQPFFALLDKDPVLARLLAQRPAFRPVVAASPYAMAGWLVLSQRSQMAQAARIQTRIAEAAGDVVPVGEQAAVSFPRPESILGLKGFAGVPEEKWRRLQAVARAALDGVLDIKRLLALPYERAREELLAIHGVGPWSADGILIRGAGPTDVLPLMERTLHGAVQAAYGLSALPSDVELTQMAEGWRPFRTWVSVFLISADFDRARALSRGEHSRIPSRNSQPRPH